MDSADIGGIISSRLSSCVAFSWTSLGMPAVFDLFLQLVEFVFFAAAQFLVNGFELFVEVILFLRALHLPLHARIDVAVDVELFQFAVENLRHAVQAFQHVEVFQQLLLFLDGNLQVGGDGVGKLGGIVHARRGDHGVVIQALREFDVLLEEPVDALVTACSICGEGSARWAPAQRGAVEAFFAGDLHGLGALHAFDQHADVAVGQAYALHDVGQRSHGENFFRLGIVHRSVMLRGQENLLVARQGLFEGAHGGFAADDERAASSAGR